MIDSQPPFLQGIRVVEMGQRIAGPLAGMVLAEQGAEVVRLKIASEPGADPVLDALLARGKTEASLDLTQPQDLDSLRQLLSVADVVIDNLPDGGLRRLGIVFDELRESIHPGLISCCIASFPDDDPRGALPGWEPVAGMSGFLYDKPLGKPLYHDFPVGSVMAGLHAANGIVAALIARLKVGLGQHVQTSLYESNLFAQVLQILVKTGVPRGFLPLKMVGTPFMSSWLCKDNRYIYLHITLPAHNARILEILEQNGYANDVRKLRKVLSAETARDPSQVKSIPEAKRLRAAYERIFLTRTADAWEQLLGKELCCIKVRTVSEWLDDSMQAGMTDVCMIDDPQFGQLKAPGATVVSPEHPPALRARKSDQEAFSEILSRWQAAPPRYEKKLGDASVLRHPLQGVRVVDLSRVIAGPCAARVLAELGAEVVSIQNPTSLDWALSFHLIFNAGKKSVTLDFTQDTGKKKLWALFDALQPHAFIQNYRHLDVAKAVGVDPDAVRSKFPQIVYTHLNAYGNEGGWRDRPGFEQVVQAVTGIQLAYGRGGKPKLLPTPIIDIGSGLSGAFATLLGLYHREKTGEGSFAATHLTSTAVLFQLNQVAASQRATALQRAKLEHDSDSEIIAGMLRALDTYACLTGPRKDVLQWMRRSGLLTDMKSSDPFAAAAQSFWKRPLAFWQQKLAKEASHGRVVLMPHDKMKRLVDGSNHCCSGCMPMARKRDFDGCPTDLTFVRSPLQLSLTPLVNISPPPIRGGSTQEVMAKIGELLPTGAGIVPYPENKPLVLWAASLVRWGYFAWRSGNI